MGERNITTYTDGCNCIKKDTCGGVCTGPQYLVEISGLSKPLTEDEKNAAIAMALLYPESITKTGIIGQDGRYIKIK
ncbi:MAG: hypothetical protein ABIF85_05035 [Nanoarchaeota archaeon]|nr:hypothetical protein [Nanoarchaeota archaeon]MBU4452343.1 hypothetical protein [Nanoarchaeota archaeon]MCG2723380.1 hypothetical protein [archaeon]